tara:strand:- start:4150 stop:4410 length:261 start_codon:yes stop_codon:yes gene_type:complete
MKRYSFDLTDKNFRPLVGDYEYESDEGEWIKWEEAKIVADHAIKASEEADRLAEENIALQMELSVANNRLLQLKMDLAEMLKGLEE